MRRFTGFSGTNRSITSIVIEGCDVFANNDMPIEVDQQGNLANAAVFRHTEIVLEGNRTGEEGETRLRTEFAKDSSRFKKSYAY